MRWTSLFYSACWVSTHHNFTSQATAIRHLLASPTNGRTDQFFRIGAYHGGTLAGRICLAHLPGEEKPETAMSFLQRMPEISSAPGGNMHMT